LYERKGKTFLRFQWPFQSDFCLPTMAYAVAGPIGLLPFDFSLAA